MKLLWHSSNALWLKSLSFESFFLFLKTEKLLRKSLAIKAANVANFLLQFRSSSRISPAFDHQTHIVKFRPLLRCNGNVLLCDFYETSGKFMAAKCLEKPKRPTLSDKRYFHLIMHEIFHKN